MRKTVSAVLCLSMIFSLLLSACAAQPVTAEATGTAMTQDVFKRYFSGDGAAALQPASLSSAPELTINTISYNDSTRALAVTGHVTDAQGHEKTMSLIGAMYHSNQKEDGVNSFVAVLTDLQQNFDVLHFNVFNSTEESTFQFDASKAGTPHLKIYLADQDTGEMYFFELDIPSQLNAISIPVSDDATCPDMLHDMLWFANVVEAETSFVPTVENEVAPYSVAGEKSLGKFTLKWDGVGGPYYYFTTPIISYSVNDVRTRAEWIFRFALSDGYCIVDGSRYDLCGIDIDGVQLGVGVGPNTIVPQGSIATSCRLLKGNGSATNPNEGGTSTVAFVAGEIGILAASKIAESATAVAAINAIIQLTKSGFTIGVDSLREDDPLRGIIIEYSDSRYRIRNNYDDNGEFLGLTLTAYKNGTATGSRTCSTYVKFHARCGATQFQSDELYSSYPYALVN